MKRAIIITLLLSMAFNLFACITEGGDSETDTDTTATVATEQTTDADTSADVDPVESVTIAMGSYRVAVSDFASDAEVAAAKNLAALLGVETVKDTEAEDGKVIFVGYTQQIQDERYDLDSLGQDGWLMDEFNGNIAVAANSQNGMEAVMRYLKENLSDSKSFPKSKFTHITKDAEVESSYTVTGSMAQTVQYAQSLENAISEAFIGDGSRSVLNFNNQNMKLQYRLCGENGKLVTELTNQDGVPYFINSSDVYVKNPAGVVMYASNSSENARMNTYRMGYYYRDIHILGQNFGAVGKNGGIDKELNLLPKIKQFNTNMTSAVTKNKEDGSISFTVEDPYDPYITMNTTFKTEEYNALRIVMRCKKSTSAAIYFAAGSHTGFSSEQYINFGVTPDDEYHTYIISFEGTPDYTGKVKLLRIDIGDVAGELIEIQAIDAIHVDYYSAGVSLDRTYHTYSDKMNEELHFVVTKETQEIAEYGVVTELDASRVIGMRIGDKNGVHESLDGVDMDSVTYVGFDVVRAGIIGWVKCIDTDEAKFNVTLQDGKYSVTIYTTVESGKTFQYGDEMYIGYRLYTDDTHSFDTFINEAYIERNPLTDIQLLSDKDNANYLGYDAKRGCYSFIVNGTNFNIYYSNKQRNFRISATMNGDDRNRKIYILGASTSGCLENGVLLDENELLMPIALEVCKNFCGENEEPLFDSGDKEYGEIIFPLVMDAQSSQTFNLIHLYTNWGIFPIKQLSSIQFIAPYYHLSCGTTESNCIAPYYVYGKDYWTLPDFRAMSAPFWSNQPQHTSIGRLHFLTYTDADESYHGGEAVNDVIDSSGPTYADIYMNYTSDDGKIKASYRHTEMPQYDENRTYYEIRLEVLEDIEIKDFKNNFSLFSFDGRDKLFRRVGYVDENNQEVSFSMDVDNGPFEEFITLGTECPYFYYFVSTGDYVNFAMLIKNSVITLNGKQIDTPFTVKNVFNGSLNYCYLTLDLGDITLKKGDTFSIDLILLPWGSQLAKNDSSVKTVRQDSCLHPVTVSTEKGTVIADTYVPKVTAENNEAVFTLRDGGGTMTVRVYGFDGYTMPVFYELINGEWQQYNTSHYAFDGYMVYNDGDGTFSYSFCVDMGTGVERTFKVTGGK